MKGRQGVLQFPLRLSLTQIQPFGGRDRALIAHTEIERRSKDDSDNRDKGTEMNHDTNRAQPPLPASPIDNAPLAVLLLSLVALMSLPILGVLLFILINVSLDAMPELRAATSTPTAAFSLTHFGKGQEPAEE